MGRIFRIFLISLAAVASLAIPAHADAPPDAAPRNAPRTAPLKWTSCEGGGFQCATLQVPIDYAKPGGEHIGISLLRLPATGVRAGSIVVNPGGPGGSGIELAKGGARIFSAKVRASYDIVGFDPRGVGRSAPIRCVDGPAMDAYLNLDPDPETAAEKAAGKKIDADRTAACVRNSGNLLPHMGTPNVARDMDRLRAALGDRKLTYLGYSYGTLIGANYAELFPKRVRALVLDGAVDPSVTYPQDNVEGAIAFEKAFEAFARDCFTKKDCPFTKKDLPTAWANVEQLLTLSDTRILGNLLDTRLIGPQITLTGILAPLYAKEQWPLLRQALRYAFVGNASALLQIHDNYWQRGKDGKFANMLDVLDAVNCLDRSVPGTPATYKAGLAADRAKAPHLGKYMIPGEPPCSGWPYKARPNRALHAAGAAPILVIGTTRDPATPYASAVALASQLDSGVLLTFEGDGHTAFGGPSKCVNAVVEKYLLTGTPPKDGRRC